MPGRLLSHGNGCVLCACAGTLVDIAKSQDAEVCAKATRQNLLTSNSLSDNLHTQVGDGTTSVVLLAGEFLKESKVRWPACLISSFVRQ